MNKSSFWKSLTDGDKQAAKDLAAEESKRSGKVVTALNILDSVMTDAEKAMPDPVAA